MLNFLDIIITFIMVKFFGETGAALSFAILSSLSLFVFLFAFKRDMGISTEIIKWSLLAFFLSYLGIYIYLVTSSSISLLIIFGLIAFFAYKFGSISKKYYLLEPMLEGIKSRFKN